MVSTIFEKINMEKSFKNGFKEPLVKVPALKEKFISCYSDCNPCCDWWIQLKILKMIGSRNCPIALSDFNYFAD